MRTIQLFLALIFISNYSLSQDLSLVFIGPVNDCAKEIGTTVTVNIINNLATPMTGSVDLSYSLNGGSFVTETLGPLVIPGSATYIYSFLTPVTLTTCQTHELVVAATTSGDINTANDTITTYVESWCHPVITDLDIVHSTGTNGELSCTVTGGTPAYMYNWENLTTFATNGTSNWTGLPAGDYELIVADANGCIADSIVTIIGLLGTPTSEQLPMTIMCSNQILSITNVQSNAILSIFDVNGKLIESHNLANSTEKINVKFSEGVYFYSISSPSSELLQNGKFLVVQ